MTWTTWLARHGQDVSSASRQRKVKRKIVPPPGRASTQILPPCASTMVRQIDRPSPMPLRLVVTNGWKRCAATSGASPAPVSATLTSHRLVGTRRRWRSPAARSPGDSIMTSMALRIRLTSTCWIWMRSASTRSASGSRRKETATPFSSRADQGERAGILDQLGQAFDPALAFAARHEFAQAADDLAGAQRLVGRLADRVAQHGRRLAFDALEQPLAALEVVADGRQRLVDLVRQGRGHLAQRGEARHVRHFRLQLLEPASRSSCWSVRSRMKPVK